jgi:hypothetical protein
MDKGSVSLVVYNAKGAEVAPRNLRKPRAGKQYRVTVRFALFVTVPYIALIVTAVLAITTVVVTVPPFTVAGESVRRAGDEGLALSIAWTVFPVWAATIPTVVVVDAACVALGLMTEWAALHRAELLEDWNLAGTPVLAEHDVHSAK